MSSINRKIIRILSTFTPDDWKRFGLFIKSPYFVSWRNYSSLYNKFYKHYKLNNTLDDSVLDKIISEVFKKNKLMGANSNTSWGFTNIQNNCDGV